MVIALFLCGCTATVHSFNDGKTNAHVERMNGNRLSGGVWRLELDAQRYEKAGQATYSLFVIYSGPGFVAIESGKSLSLTIDGRRAEIDGSGSARHREFVLPGLVEETAFYHDIDTEMIREIAYAHEVTVEIKGTNSVLQRYFKEKNFSNFQLFYENIVIKDASRKSTSPLDAKRVAQ